MLEMTIKHNGELRTRVIVQGYAEYRFGFHVTRVKDGLYSSIYEERIFEGCTSEDQAFSLYGSSITSHHADKQNG
ncbi:MAG: hypothetical protein RBT65_19460 [Methanolobus sp.]|nr:hypothetical protein [Methanolobus sp.]